MKLYGLLLFWFLCLSHALAQDFRFSLPQYQYNALAINPGYAARLPMPSFEMVYLGNFSADGQLSQFTHLSMQAPVKSGGVGAVVQFVNSGDFGELNIRPTYALATTLGNSSKMAFGIGLGISYIDIRTTSFFGNSQNDFMTV